MKKLKHLSILIALIFNFSLSGNVFAETEESASTIEHEEHEHEHHAPHNGTLVVFGDEFAHLELVLDSASGKLTAYALDGEAEYAVRLKQEAIEISVSVNDNNATLKLNAVDNPLTGEVVGDTSEFAAQSDLLKGVKNFKGAITKIDIKGTEFNNVEFRFPEGNE